MFDTVRYLTVSVCQYVRATVERFSGFLIRRHLVTGETTFGSVGTTIVIQVALRAASSAYLFLTMICKLAVPPEEAPLFESFCMLANPPPTFATAIIWAHVLIHARERSRLAIWYITEFDASPVRHADAVPPPSWRAAERHRCKPEQILQPRRGLT